jgi:hypothetical protein
MTGHTGLASLQAAGLHFTVAGVLGFVAVDATRATGVQYGSVEMALLAVGFAAGGVILSTHAFPIGGCQQ